uniref:Uncharacterized protein n=1 Tax=Candidatus Berkiella aquae TaxID=295108 RepID=A0A0Q9YFV0_9GAMM
MKRVKMIKKQVKISKIAITAPGGHCQGGGGW